MYHYKLSSLETQIFHKHAPWIFAELLWKILDIPVIYTEHLLVSGVFFSFQVNMFLGFLYHANHLKELLLLINLNFQVAVVKGVEVDITLLVWQENRLACGTEIKEKTGNLNRFNLGIWI